MRINESIFRKVLREEARRVLNEVQGTAPAAPAATGTGTAAPGLSVPAAGPITPQADAAVKAARAAYDASYEEAEAATQNLQQALTTKGTALGDLESGLVPKILGQVGQAKNPATSSKVLTAADAALKSSKNPTAAAITLIGSLMKGQQYADWWNALGALTNVGVTSQDMLQADPSKAKNLNQQQRALVDAVAPVANKFMTPFGKLSGSLQALSKAEFAAGVRGSATPSTAPAPASAPAQAPVKDWAGYNARVKNGQAVNKAWTDFVVSTANTSGSTADFGSFVKYYNALVKQTGVKALSPDQMIKHLRDKIAAVASGVPAIPAAGAGPALTGGQLIEPAAGPGRTMTPEQLAAAQAQLTGR